MSEEAELERMTTFTNTAESARETAPQYTAALLALLGERDPMRVQEQLADWADAAVAGLSERELRTPERPGKWSIIQVLQHLVETELVYAYRTRTILTRETPPIEGYDQDRWASTLRYQDAPIGETLLELRALRGRNLRLLRALSEEELDRAGLHSERGLESVRQIRSLIAAHDLVHRNQIERIKRSLTTATG
jgi:hypothetical protein